MVETLVRPVTHTPAQLRVDLQEIRSYSRDYFPNGDHSWAGSRSWWAMADSSRTVSNGGGLTARFIEAAHFENDWHDALKEDAEHSNPFTSSIGIIPDEPEEDWTQIDGEIHAEFSGPIQDQKLAKLRELAKERQNLRRRVVELETERHAEITDPKDPRMAPLLAKAAKEADTQGYCSVYDQISNAVGFPTRPELAAHGYLTSTYNVEVRIELEPQFVTVQVEAASSLDAKEEVMHNWSASDLAEYLGSDESTFTRWDTLSASLSND